MRRVVCPGTGCFGLPCSSRMRAADHRSVSGLRRTVATLKTPTLVPMRCSADRKSNPIQSPSSQRSSKLPGMELVFGILKCTTSPNSATLDITMRPLIFWRDVLPSGRTRHLVINAPAWRMSHGTTFMSSLIFMAVRASNADLSVRT